MSPTWGQLLDRFLFTRRKCCFRKLGTSLFLSSRDIQIPKKAMIFLCWLLITLAGKWKATICLTILMGKKLFPDTPKPQRRGKLEGLYSWRYSLSLPGIRICIVYDMLCNLNLHYLTSLFSMYQKISDVNENMWGKKEQGRESCKCLFYAQIFLS